MSGGPGRSLARRAGARGRRFGWAPAAMTAVAVGLLVAGLPAVLVAARATGSRAGPVPGGPGGRWFVAGSAGLCLGARRRQVGAVVTVDPCGSGPLQRWEHEPDGAMRAGGFCLAAGPPVRLARCERDRATQQWHRTGDQLVVRAGGACAGVPDERPPPGTGVTLAPCDGGGHQRWYRVAYGWT